jgi:pyridinium-3,5-bisthiocarboxylic acid mononucleotide nickel chelatase
MSKAIYLESVSGVAGDMFAASFVNAGVVTAEELAALPALLGMKGVGVTVETVRRAELEATALQVTPANGFETPAQRRHGGAGRHGHPAHAGAGEIHLPFPLETHCNGHARYSEIDQMLAESRLEEPVRELARRIFQLLAQAEASVHGYPVERVEFHEVGAVDSIMDVVMASYCVHKLGPCAIYASPIRPGRGHVKMAHGTLPVPPPASLKLLAGLPVAPTPTAILRPNVELSTPTGIAILKALAPRFVTEVPPGTILGHGLGAGTMDLGAFPNVFRIILLEEVPPPASAERFDRDRVVEISCNVDDDTAEHLAWMVAQLMDRGALDAWLTPMTGKKGRPAVCLSVLASTADWSATAEWILEHGSTFGLRYRTLDRLKLIPRFERRETSDGLLTYKLGVTKAGKILKEKPEFEDVKRIWERPEN